MDKHTEQCTRREKADLVFKNCKVVNVFVGGIEECDIAVSDGIIVGVGHYQGKKEIDLEGAYVAPGLIDSHLHIESTMLSPGKLRGGGDAVRHYYVHSRSARNRQRFGDKRRGIYDQRSKNRSDGYQVYAAELRSRHFV